MDYRYGGGGNSCSFDIDLYIAYTHNNGKPNQEQERPATDVSATVELAFGPVAVKFTPFTALILTQTHPAPPVQPRIGRVGYHVTLTGPGGVQEKNIIVKDVLIQPGDEALVSGTYHTQFVVSGGTDRLVEITGVGNIGIIDAPFPIKARLYELWSGTVSGTCAGLDVSGVASGSPTYMATGSIAAFAQDGGGTWSIAPSPGGGNPLGYTSPPVNSGSFSDAKGSISASDCTLTLTNNDFTGSVTGSVARYFCPAKSFAMAGVVRAMEAAYPDTLTGTCSKFKGDMSTDFAITSGAFDVYYAQRYAVFTCIYREGGYSAGSSVDEWQTVSCSIKPSSLASVGDDPRAGRLPFRAWRFGGIGLSHATSVLIDDCTALTKNGNWAGEWQAASGAAPTSGSDGIAFSGSVRRAFTHDVSLGSYRYLRLRVKSAVANAPLSIAIGGKTWQGKTGAADTFTDIKLDLCAEANQTVTTSTHDTKWPLDRNDDLTGDELPKNEGVYYGVGRCGAIVLTGAAGASFVVSRVELVRDAPPVVTWLPTFYRGQIVTSGEGGQTVDEPWPVAEYPDRAFGTGSEGTSSYFARRFLDGNVDGRRGLEEKDSGYVYSSPPSGTSTVSPFQQSIKALVDSINTVNENGVLLNPGWSATSSKPAPTSGCGDQFPSLNDCFLNDSLPAAYLAGGGALALADGTWQYGFDQTELSAAAQVFLDQVEWFPGCGDVFDVQDGAGANDDGALCLRPAAILRAALDGLALTSGKQPAAGKTVELRQGDPAPGAVVSSGTSGANGYYKTSNSPFAKTVIAATAKSGSRSAVFTAYGRKRQRIVFLVPAGRMAVLRVAHAINPKAGWYAQLEIMDDGALVWRRTTNNIPKNQTDFLPDAILLPAPSVGTLSAPVLHISRFSRVTAQWHYEAAANGDTDRMPGVYESISSSSGASWTEPVLIMANAKYPALFDGIISGPGDLIKAVYIPTGGDATTGTIQATRETAGGAPSPTYTFKMTGGADLVVEENGFAGLQSYNGGAVWLLFCICAGEDMASTWRSSNAGKTWGRIN